MPRKNSSPGHAFSRHVAPFAPLALALLMSRAVLPGGGGTELTETETPTEAGAVHCDEVVDFQDCHSRFPTGCSQKPGKANYDAYLNLLKNQLISPASAASPVRFLVKSDYDNFNARIPGGLGGKNHADFKEQLATAGEGQIYGVIGYLYYAKAEGEESSNCQLPKDPPDFEDVDYHIGIGFDGDVAQQLGGKNKPSAHTLSSNSVIVEMTPHYRARFENGKWTVNALKKALGRQVKVVGQLMADNEHNVASQNCAIAKKSSEKDSCWRLSVWELHPVTSFQVCRKDSCTVNSLDWAELDELPQ